MSPLRLQREGPQGRGSSSSQRPASSPSTGPASQTQPRPVRSTTSATASKSQASTGRSSAPKTLQALAGDRAGRGRGSRLRSSCWWRSGATGRSGTASLRPTSWSRCSGCVTHERLLGVPRAAQRVRDETCIVCARKPVDPAHIVPRGLGGCDDELCVVPLCRSHHRLYDDGTFDLLPYLEPHFREEQMHAVGHVGIARALVRVTNEKRAA